MVLTAGRWLLVRKSVSASWPSHQRAAVFPAGTTPVPGTGVRLWAEPKDRKPTGSVKDRADWYLSHMSGAALPKWISTPNETTGRKVAAAHSERVDVGVLSEFPEFIEFKSRSHAPRQAGEPELAKVEATPREAVSTAVDEANAAAAAEVLDRVRQREPAFLERLVLRY